MRSEHFFPNIVSYKLIDSGIVKSSSPSNIALVKYWGKKEVQIPSNTSISFTLNKCRTETEVSFSIKYTQGFDVKVIFEGKENKIFTEKIIKFFEYINPFVPFLQSYALVITTQNTFPHSSGIASSASGISALALCLVQIEQLIGIKLSEEEQLLKASFLSRLGSGSACRSIYKGLVLWGEHVAVDGSNKRYAIPYPYQIHPIFKTFKDTILLIHNGQKTISSTQGHDFMYKHPYAKKRFSATDKNIKKNNPDTKKGDLEAFGQLVEHEALSLHAMMMTSSPAFILMKPNTILALEKVWQFRQKTQLPLYFTLDAGANVHLLYPSKDAKEIEAFIVDELANLCEDGKYISDTVSFD